MREWKTPSRMNSICVIFHRLGPYHWARLNSVGGLMPTLGLELFGETSEYRWDKVGGPGSFRRVTLFPESDGRRKYARELVRRIHEILDQNRPSVVAIPGWSSPGALAALSWCLKTGAPAIVMSESQASDAMRRWPREVVKQCVISLCSAGLVGGAAHVDYLAGLGMSREHIFTGYDVIDNDYFARHAEIARQNAARLRAQLNLPERYFLACSRFIAKKNLSRLLSAYRDYRRSAGPDAWKLVLLGDGPLKPQLLTQIQQLGLVSDVLLPGFKQYDELPTYYGLAGAFVHASAPEQWGLVVNEAMACGLPVLVSERCGCAPDLVADGKNGFAFHPLHVSALARLLQRVAGSECDRAAMGAAGREIIARWSLKTFAANLKNASETAIGTPRRTAGLFQRMVLHALLQY
jgi:1,2-diacylglycerol 3-alpha-glucosyltransferase